MPGVKSNILISVFIFLVTSCLDAQMDSILSRIQLEMDYRFRVEHDWDSRKSDGSYRNDRSRLRYRLRTGAAYSHKAYSFGFRIRTGNPRKQQDPQLTLGKGRQEFSTLPIGFEKAFFEYKKKRYKFWVGKNGFPFKKNNELFWSDNVFPEGVMMERNIFTHIGLVQSLDLVVGHFIMNSNDGLFLDDAYLQGIQAKLSFKDQVIELFPSFYFFRNIPDIPDGAHLFELNYSILHLGSRFKPLHAHKLYFELDYYENLSDYEDDAPINSTFSNQTSGYTLGVQYGHLEKKNNWMFKFIYANLERYSILDYMAQNDWARWDYSESGSPDGRLSNMWGMEATVAYAVTDKINLVCKYYLVEQLVASGLERETGQRIRLDIDVRL